MRAPLKAEFSGQPSAYYKSEIEREETYYERDSNGRDQRKTRTTTVYSNMKYGQCLVEDASGKVGIDFDGAEVEAVQVVNEPTAPPGGGGGVIGGVLSALSEHEFQLPAQGKHSGARHCGLRARRSARGRADRQARERLEEQDLRHQPQVGGGAHQVAHLDHALAAGDRDHPAGAGGGACGISA